MMHQQLFCRNEPGICHDIPEMIIQNDLDGRINNAGIWKAKWKVYFKILQTIEIEFGAPEG